MVTRCHRRLIHLSLWSTLLLLFTRAYGFASHHLLKSTSKADSFVALGVANLRDADFVEMMLGGQRFEMVPLPDSMLDTTLYVGNLNEFVRDEDLSDLFQVVSHLQSVPACVVRKINYDSLKYGFVTFPTIEEKEVRLQST